MLIRLGFILIVSSFLIVSSAGSNFAQELKADTDALVSPEPEVQWLWGEVLSVNPQDKTILVKYVDYDSDTEKEIIITIDPKTTYENVESLEQIQPQDTVSVDYMSGKDGLNLAENISVEKPENNLSDSIDEGSKGKGL